MCAGVPLVAKALGGLLRFKRTEDEWKYVEDSELRNLQGETSIWPPLTLSYRHLPLELRQCFAYCAVFPKGFRIRKQELILLWMAHGYISSKGILELELVGERIVDELVLRSLLQKDISRESFFIHDLIHDLAESVWKNKGDLVFDVTQLMTENEVRRRQAETNITKTTNTRQVNFSRYFRLDIDTASTFKKFGRLRVVNGAWGAIYDLPSSVGNLKHLRLLNLSGSTIRTLPKSLCNIWNLQTLNLDGCFMLNVLPKKMRHLINLRHLCLEGCSSLSDMPSKLGELNCLKTLSLFIVGPNRGTQLEELQCLNLGGQLRIQHLERVKDHIDAKQANLAEKMNLRHLSLVWESSSASKLREDAEEKVLEALEPHPNIETLSIQGFGGRCFPVWMSNSTVEKIVEVKIKGCKNCLRLPPLGELSSLKLLRLQYLVVEYIIENEIQGGNPVNIQFSSLETLELLCLPNLKGFLKEEGTAEAFPKLLNLRIEFCVSSLMVPPLSALASLELRFCSSLTLTSFSKSQLGNLPSLKLSSGENIPVEMLENLTNLKSLEISEAKEHSVPEEGMRALKSLTRLKIRTNWTMACLPEWWFQHLTALRDLSICNCPELVELPEDIKNLHYLETLELCCLPKMTCLPKALKHLSSLKILHLEGLSNLNSLPGWLDNLTSLEDLEIGWCRGLVRFQPAYKKWQISNIFVSGDAQNCKKQCERGTGKEWDKIAHIPCLEVSDN